MDHTRSINNLARLAKLERVITVATSCSSAAALLLTMGHLVFFAQPGELAEHHRDALQTFTGLLGVLILVCMLAILATRWQSATVRRDLQCHLNSMSRHAQRQQSELATLQAKAECIANELLAISQNCDGIEAHVLRMLHDGHQPR